ncbi:unnamed protein product [Durusdinium trenchii]|uniref:DUS-like FMN-binding domain-containing protein n=1 Tax=Durusdinium trenchii TaxID=1381693 RepID=A0ABP0P8S0_9DINO
MACRRELHRRGSRRKPLAALTMAGGLWRCFTGASRPSQTAWEWWESLGNPKWVCSPMIDQSERAFRILCRRHGVHLCYTPMLHAEPFASDETYRTTYFDAWKVEELDRPLIAQLGGDHPQTVLRAAKILEPHVEAVDLNFGCPTEDARKGGHASHSPRCRRYGAWLLDDVPQVTRLVRTLARNLQVPVTAKIRLLENRRRSVDLALAIQESGASALTVHGRTRQQRPKYAEKHGIECLAPDWETIGAIAQTLSIPVIANGGIETRQDAERCLAVTHAAAVMSAEALLEQPDLFVETEALAGRVDGSDGSTDARVRRMEESVEELPIPRMFRLAREFLELAQRYPSPLKYPPTKSHLFKILHRLIDVDQAMCRRKAASGQQLTLKEELKLKLMCCPVTDFDAIHQALDYLEAHADEQLLGDTWYRRWRPNSDVMQSRVRRIMGCW